MALAALTLAPTAHACVAEDATKNVPHLIYIGRDAPLGLVEDVLRDKGVWTARDKDTAGFSARDRLANGVPILTDGNNHGMLYKPEDGIGSGVHVAFGNNQEMRNYSQKPNSAITTIIGGFYKNLNNGKFRLGTGDQVKKLGIWHKRLAAACSRATALAQAQEGALSLTPLRNEDLNRSRGRYVVYFSRGTPLQDVLTALLSIGGAKTELPNFGALKLGLKDVITLDNQLLVLHHDKAPDNTPIIIFSAGDQPFWRVVAGNIIADEMTGRGLIGGILKDVIGVLRDSGIEETLMYYDRLRTALLEYGATGANHELFRRGLTSHFLRGTFRALL